MIIWIASYPKSGNTWLRALLSTYFFLNEKNFDFNILNKIPNFIKDKYFSPIVNLNKLKKNPLQIANYWDAAQSRINLTNEIQFFKTHTACASYKGQWFTTSENTIGYIYIVRDPRSVVCSQAAHSNITLEESTNNLLDENFVGYNQKNNYNLAELTSSWKINYLSWKKKKKFPGIIIKYEDLKDNTYNEFEKILFFLKEKINFDLDITKLKKTVELCSFSKLKSIENKVGFKEAKNGKFFRKGEKDSWKNELSKDLQKKIEISLNQEMNELDYL